MQRKQRKSKQHKKKLIKQGVKRAIGHGNCDNGLPMNRAAEWDGKMPSKCSRRNRQKTKQKLKEGKYE